MTVTDIALRQETAAAAPGELTIDQIIAQTKKIQQCISAVMKEGEHYGVIPGTSTKPTLLKPGAEKLCLLFRLDPEYETLTSVETPERIAYTIRCVLFHIPTSQRVASGLGSCNSREKKYLRAAPKKCPKCQKETIFRSKNEGEGWYCWRRKDGCGATFKPDDPTVVDQPTGIEDPADLANTILKMACKRALVAAVLNATAASDFFTQDVEDLTEKAAEYTPPKEAPPAPKAPTATTPPAPSVGGPGAGDTRPTAPAAAKPALAPSIKHNGVFASPEAIKKLHVLRHKSGVPECKGGCEREVERYEKRAKGLVKKTERCVYHTQLAAFRDCDGKPITTAVDLSEDQIANLIGRYEAQIARQGARAAEPPDIGAVVDVEGKISGEGVVSIRNTLKGKELDEAELCAMFGVDAIEELSADSAGTALALVLTHGTPQFERVRDEAFGPEPSHG